MSSNARPTAVAAPALRQFAFFDVVPVKDVHDATSSPELLKNPGDISCLASSTSGLLLADIHGTIHLLGKDFEAEQSWAAHTSGRVMHMIVRKGVLVTIGEEDGVRFPVLKIWDLQKFNPKSGQPALIRSVKVQHNNKPHPVSTIALSATLSHLALGLGDGTVLLYRHLDQSLAATGTTTLPKPKLIHESPSEPITGLGFCEPHTDEHGTAHPLFLFVVTTNRVLAYQAGGRGAGGSAHVVDEVGAALGCAVMDRKAKEIVLARDDAVYLCSTEGRGNCLVLEGHKTSVQTHSNYLLAVFPPVAPSLASASATVRHFAARATSALPAEVTKVSILDLDNKLVAYSGTFPDGVREAVSVWGNVYVLSEDGELSCIREKPMSEKLDILYKKGQYTLALVMARTQQLDPERVADVHRHYGDFLYGRSEYDSAMQQYVQTIGHLQPSYVIRKFLDAQRIHNLVTYLQELHALGLANSDHTTLLLNTYTKLKDVSRLESFIRTESKRNGDGPDGELPFDLDTAIRVCRQAGYSDQAGYLAKKYERHEDYLRIQIEDAERYKDALDYIRRLGLEAAESNLARYGRQLLNNLPEETTQLMIDICTSTGPLAQDMPEVASPTKQSTGASYLSFMALSRGSATDTTPVPPSPTATTITAKPDSSSRRQASIMEDATPSGSISGMAAGNGTGAGSGSGSTTPSLPSWKSKPVRRPSPRIFFAHFVDHLDRFVGFLEAVALRRWGQAIDGSVPNDFTKELAMDDAQDKTDQAAVWNTLLELYLTLPVTSGPGLVSSPTAATTEKAKDSSDKDAALFREKAIRLLQSTGLPYDPTHALILCSTRSFIPGLVLLWERRGMHEDVLRLWMDRSRSGETGASAEVVRYLRAYGNDRPALYPLVLRFLTSTNELLQRHRKDVEVVLEHIEAEKIMSPVAVVQVLSRNNVASVGLVKQWLMTRIKEAREEIRTDEQLTTSYRTETQAKLKQAEDFNPDHPRVFHSNRCTMCRESLTLPAVHFMCNHSYHQKCLQDRETECPTCARAHGHIREIRANNARLADQHDVFLAEVRDSGFSAVANAFGRGVLNVNTRVEDGVA